jgi:small subunit ribosomal protein S8
MDLIADSLTRIRNAQMRGKAFVDLVDTKAVRALLEVVKSEGFIGSFREVPCAKAAKAKLTARTAVRVELRYFSDGSSLISACERISKSGRRVYKGVADLSKEKAGLGIKVISTSQGVISDREARKRGIGGEILARIY